MTILFAAIAGAVVLGALFYFMRQRSNDMDDGLSEADRSLLDPDDQNSGELAEPLLELEQADGQILRASLCEGTVSVGRVGVDRTPGCFIVLDASTISRQHAEFELRGEQIWVTDLESANGTKVNGSPVLTSTQIFQGDRIAFDEIVLTLRSGEPRAEDPSDTAKFAVQPTAEDKPVDSPDFGATAIMEGAPAPQAVNPAPQAVSKEPEDSLESTQIWSASPDAGTAAPEPDTNLEASLPSVEETPIAEPGSPDSSAEDFGNATMILDRSTLKQQDEDDATLLMTDPPDEAISAGADSAQLAGLKPSESDKTDPLGIAAGEQEDDDKTVVELPPSIAKGKNQP